MTFASGVFEHLHRRGWGLRVDRGERLGGQTEMGEDGFDDGGLLAGSPQGGAGWFSGKCPCSSYPLVPPRAARGGSAESAPVLPIREIACAGRGVAIHSSQRTLDFSCVRNNHFDAQSSHLHQRFDGFDVVGIAHRDNQDIPGVVDGNKRMLTREPGRNDHRSPRIDVDVVENDVRNTEGARKVPCDRLMFIWSGKSPGNPQLFERDQVLLDDELAKSSPAANLDCHTVPCFGFSGCLIERRTQMHSARARRT